MFLFCLNTLLILIKETKYRSMETRKERYAKYRQEIERMPSSSFAKDGSFLGDTSGDDELAEKANFKSDSSTGFTEESEKTKAPYLLYLKKRRTFLWLKILLLVLAVIGLALMYIFFVKE